MSGEAARPRSGAATRRRSVARLAAVQALYQIDLSGAPPETVIAEFLKHRLGREIDGEQYGEADPALFADIVRGTIERRADLDTAISAVLTPDWPLERLETVLRAVLRAGAFELVARPDVPAPVAISEYLDIAHAFFSGKEPGLVNGVLDKLAHRLRPDDVGDENRGGPSAQ
ncbi:MAG TPA: transcription antitermination factor NusB [Stellaceae bacterium]|jgi:transcription antitermination protein NusB|nr:transcription antitermination factor NusB [Stellaceae bacterium]